MKIALLEDNPGNSEFIQTVLKMEGHQIYPYTDGDSLFQALQTTGDFFPYDVAIIDLWLPGSYSGQDVMHHIQQGYSSKHLPFIVLSALSLNILNLVQADFPETPIIRKPFKSRELLAAIQLVVARP
jgi:DNA-binding response OmpR family regulator